jgi:hypothetical protein
MSGGIGADGVFERSYPERFRLQWVVERDARRRQLHQLEWE